MRWWVRVLSVAAVLVIGSCSQDLEVNWENYAPEVRERIDAFAEAGDCGALQAELTAALNDEGEETGSDSLQYHNIRMEQVYDDALWKTLEKLKSEGKVRDYGIVLGPAIGWLYEGVNCIRERDLHERPAYLQHARATSRARISRRSY